MNRTLCKNCSPLEISKFNRKQKYLLDIWEELQRIIELLKLFKWSKTAFLNQHQNIHSKSMFKGVSWMLGGLSNWNFVWLPTVEWFERLRTLDIGEEAYLLTDFVFSDRECGWIGRRWKREGCWPWGPCWGWSGPRSCCTAILLESLLLSATCQ